MCVPTPQLEVRKICEIEILEGKKKVEKGQRVQYKQRVPTLKLVKARA